MKKKLNLYLFAFMLVLLILFIFFTFLINNHFYIIVKNFLDDTIVFQKNISPGQCIALSYSHSVAQTPVWEYFEINKEGKLILTETHFYDHGAGLPYTAFGEEIFVCEDHKFKIKNMHRDIRLPLYYRIYHDRGNIFIFDNQKIELSDVIGDALLIIDIYQQNTIKSIVKYFRNLGGINLDE